MGIKLLIKSKARAKNNVGGEEIACCNRLVESVVLALLRWV